MRVRALWLPVLAVFSVLGVAGIAPTCAKSNGAGVRSSYFVFRAPIEHGDARSRMSRGRFGVANGVRLRRPVQMQTLLPSAGWSFGSFIDSLPIAVVPAEDVVVVDPYVVVIADWPNAPSSSGPAGAPADAGSVGGCRPIPSGYHCDAAH